MKAYHEASSSQWATSQDRNFNKKTKYAQEICDCVNSKDIYTRIVLSEIQIIMGRQTKNKGWSKTKKLLQILVNHGYLERKFTGSGQSKLYFHRKEGVILKPEWVEEASEY